jgi:hypothetical protein
MQTSTGVEQCSLCAAEIMADLLPGLSGETAEMLPVPAVGGHPMRRLSVLPTALLALVCGAGMQSAGSVHTAADARPSGVATARAQGSRAQQLGGVAIQTRYDAVPAVPAGGTRPFVVKLATFIHHMDTGAGFTIVSQAQPPVAAPATFIHHMGAGLGSVDVVQAVQTVDC